MKSTLVTSAAAALLLGQAAAQTTCKTVIAPNYQPPTVAAGWQAQIVASGLRKPRSIQFDSEGGLLVVDAGVGIYRLTFKDNGGTCLEVDQKTLVVNNTALNHGMALSTAGDTLFASTVQSVFRWSYDAKSGRTTAGPQEVVTGMRNNNLTTRTLTLSSKAAGMLIVSRGNAGDDDPAIRDVNSGVSQIRAFDVSRVASSGGTPWDFATSGRRLGWGLRNAVAVGEHPVTGGIYSMDNSVDGIVRDGVDVSLRNPAEELNFHGLLTDNTMANQGGNYGFPICHAVGDPSRIPGGEDLHVGSQFGINSNDTNSDATCNSGNYTAPRLVFPAHYAPMDIKFDAEGSTAYLSFRGSLNKTNPVGYRVGTVAFNATSGEPTAPSTSPDALKDLIYNGPGNTCPDNCMRPVGMNWDAKGRLWVAADSTGEIYVLEKQAGTATAAEGVMVTKAAGSGASRLSSGMASLGLLYGGTVAAIGVLVL